MNSPTKYARYIGDSVYANFDGYGIVLTTESHHWDEATNRIVLEPEVVAAFTGYVAWLKAKLSEEQSIQPTQEEPPNG